MDFTGQFHTHLSRLPWCGRPSTATPTRWRSIQADPELACFRERHEPQETLRHKAARGGHAAAVRLFLSHGADLYALNCQAQDALSVLLTSNASEQAMLETARVLLDAHARTASDATRNCQIVSVDGDLASEDEAVRLRAEEDLERLRALDTARRLRASDQDYPRLFAVLLRTADRPQDAEAWEAALALAQAAGHEGATRVLSEWLRRQGHDTTTSPDTYPIQEKFRLCSDCLAFWAADSDRACPNCGANDPSAEKTRQAAWWPWGQPDAAPPCLETQEESIHAALRDLDARALRIAETRAGLERKAGANVKAGRNAEGARGARLAEAASQVRSLQCEFEHILWSAEVASWQNLLQVAMADWEFLNTGSAGCESSGATF